jgi:hypothetical protein
VNLSQPQQHSISYLTDREDFIVLLHNALRPHLLVVVLEEPQSKYLVDDVVGVLSSVVMRDANQNHQAAADLADKSGVNLKEAKRQPHQSESQNMY